MRKLSMKKPGTPAIEEDSESGSGGVSAEGLGARLPRCGVAAEPPLEPLFPEPARPFDFERPPAARVDPGVGPCGCWALTCGVVARFGELCAVGGGAGVELDCGVGLAVVVVETSGGLVEVVGSGGVLASLVAFGDP